MRLDRTRSTMIGMTLLGLLLVTGCHLLKGAPEIQGQIRIATGNQAGVYYLYGKAYATLIKRSSPHARPTVLATAASAENVAMVSDHSAEIGFTQADIAAMAPRDQLRTLARLYDDYVHLVVRDDSPVRALDDLRGHRVSTGESGSGTQVTVERLLGAAAIDPHRDISEWQLNLDDSATALRERRIDAFFFAGGPPVTAIAQLARAVRTRLIDLSGYVTPLRQAHGAYYAVRVVPQSAYGTAPVMSIAIANYLVVPTTMSNSTAYALTRALFSDDAKLARAHPAGERLNPRSAINTHPLPLHPGALRYFREVKT